MDIFRVFVCILSLGQLGRVVSTEPEVNFVIDGEECSTNEVEEITAQNIAKLEGCVKITGNVIIKTESFENMHPYNLEIFSTVENITGFLLIEANHPDFRNLSFFRNLKYIHGHTPHGLDTSYTLDIGNSSLTSLELVSLKKIKGSGVVIVDNVDLCYADTIDWEDILDENAKKSIVSNRNLDDCENDGFTCDLECSQLGCWGSGPDKCRSCKNYKQGSNCVAKCDDSTQSQYPCKGCPFGMFENKEDKCLACHKQCNGCRGPSEKHCIRCKHFKDDKSCVQVCPISKYSDLEECQPCPKRCQFGCIATGHEPPIMCNNCSSHKSNHILCAIGCPVGYYPSRISNNKFDCKLCHIECSACYGPESDTCFSCKNVKLYEHTITDKLNYNSVEKFTCILKVEESGEYPNYEKDANEEQTYHFYYYSSDDKDKDKDNTWLIICVVVIAGMLISSAILLWYYRRFNNCLTGQCKYTPVKQQPLNEY